MLKGGSVCLAVYANVFLASIGIGVIGPVLPGLLREITGREVAEISDQFGLIISAYLIASFFASPVLGRLSDFLGRRSVLIIAIVGQTLDSIVAALASSVWLLVLTRVIAGLCGSTWGIAYALITDHTAPERRSKAFARLAAISSAGTIMGPGLGGLLSTFDTRAPFVASALLSFINLLIALRFMPVAPPQRPQPPFSISDINPFAVIAQLRFTSIGTPLIIACVLTAFAPLLVQPVFILFAQYRLEWQPTEISVFLTFVPIVQLVVQSAIAPIAIDRLENRVSVLFGWSVIAVATFLMGFVTSSWQIYALSAASLIGTISGPAMQAILADRVPQDRVGASFGSLGSLQVAVMSIAPLLGASFFGYFTSPAAPLILPGSTFFLAGLIVTLALPFAAIGTRRVGAADCDLACNMPKPPEIRSST